MKIRSKINKVLYVVMIMVCVLPIFILSSCSDAPINDTQGDIDATQQIGDTLSQNQPTPTDIQYSLERYNLIRRAYWVNGMREKAISLPCEITKPLGYIVLFTESGDVIGTFNVDGKISALSSYLTPSYWYDRIYYGKASTSWSFEEIELPDVDGSYGSNDSFGIFFFTPDGKYIEWTGTYLYSDIPFSVDDTLLGGY